MIQSLNPATGILLRSFDPLTSDALTARLALASAAAKTYPRESLDQRIFWMRRLATLLDADIEELASLMTAEMGKTLAAARQEVLKCAAVCRYYADNAAHILAPDPIPTEHADSYIRYDPLGVILAVMPWNFPLWQVFRFAAPALMAGNIGLLKHAANVPQCAIAIEALIRRAGFPRGTFQTLLIEARQVETLLADDRVAAVTVTGSEAAGRAIAAQAGWLIKKSVLELGGSDPFIVLSSADLDLAVPNAVKARCINNGQSCIAAKRFIIHDAVYDEFESRFTAAMAGLRVGDPTDPNTEIGPIATPQLLDELLTQVSIARAGGGKVLTGGGRAHVTSLAATNGNGHPAGNYFQPTVIANLSPLSPLSKAEIFGPIALLFRVSGLEEAITLANDTPFGLAASAWTSNLHEQNRLSADLQCGAVFFNQIVASDPRLPFGGIKHSGYGRELSSAGMREFLNAKTVVVGHTLATRAAASETTRLEPLPASARRETPPNEFSNFAEQIRTWEPRKPSSLDPVMQEQRLPTRRPATEVRHPAPPQPQPLQRQPQLQQPPALAPRLASDTGDLSSAAPLQVNTPPQRTPEPAQPAPDPVPLQPESTPDPVLSKPAPEQPRLEPRRPPNGLRPIVFDSVPDPVRLAPIVWDDKPEERKLAPIVWDSKPDERKLAPIVWDSSPNDRSLTPDATIRGIAPNPEPTHAPSTERFQLAPLIDDPDPLPERAKMAPLVSDSDPNPAPRKLPRLIYGDEDPDDKPPTRGSILGL
jgi:succinate-semialdehyde dehydrogenase/glutarate-semialdehyde dehydrogenase